MTICDKCGRLTSSPVIGASFKGKLLMQEGKEICKICFIKIIEKARGGDERAAYCANSKRPKKNYKRIAKNLNQQSKVQK